MAVDKLQQDLDALVAAAGKPETPRDLGNLPSEAPPVETAQPDETPAPVEDGPDDDAPEAERSDESATLKAELEAMRREMAFLRAGAPAIPAAPQMPAEPELPFAITEDDVNTILQGGPKAAQYMQNALAAVARATAQATEQRLTAMYQQTRTAETQGTSLRTAFYSEHKDLEPYQEIVGAQAQRVAQAMPWADAKLLMEKTAEATREVLRSRGIQIAARGTNRRSRVRPAMAETGGNRPNGKANLNPVERDIFQMLGAGR